MIEYAGFGGFWGVYVTTYGIGKDAIVESWLLPNKGAAPSATDVSRISTVNVQPVSEFADDNPSPTR